MLGMEGRRDKPKPRLGLIALIHTKSSRRLDYMTCVNDLTACLTLIRLDVDSSAQASILDSSTEDSRFHQTSMLY
jgi:hypothetical protein